MFFLNIHLLTPGSSFWQTSIFSLMLAAIFVLLVVVFGLVLFMYNRMGRDFLKVKDQLEALRSKSSRHKTFSSKQESPAKGADSSAENLARENRDSLKSLEKKTDELTQLIRQIDERVNALGQSDRESSANPLSGASSESSDGSNVEDHHGSNVESHHEAPADASTGASSESSSKALDKSHSGSPSESSDKSHIGSHQEPPTEPHTKPHSAPPPESPPGSHPGPQTRTSDPSYFGSESESGIGEEEQQPQPENAGWKEKYFSMPNAEKNSFIQEVSLPERINYRLQVDENTGRGKFEFYFGEEANERIMINQPDQFIKPACSIRNGQITNPTGVKLVEPGKVKRTSEGWYITQKAVVEWI